MIFETITTGGCRSYLIGCEETCAAARIDSELGQLDHYLALSARDSLRIRYLIDTHTHADHFSATRQLARQLGVPVVMHCESPAPFVDLRLQGGELLIVGRLRLQALHTPGHTRDSMCLCVEDRVFTGDTLLIGGTGRTDLPSGDAGALYESLFEGVLRLDPLLKVFPLCRSPGFCSSYRWVAIPFAAVLALAVAFFRSKSRKVSTAPRS